MQLEAVVVGNKYRCFFRRYAMKVALYPIGSKVHLMAFFLKGGDQ